METIETKNLFFDWWAFLFEAYVGNTGHYFIFGWEETCINMRVFFNPSQELIDTIGIAQFLKQVLNIFPSISLSSEQVTEGFFGSVIQLRGLVIRQWVVELRFIFFEKLTHVILR